MKISSYCGTAPICNSGYSSWLDHSVLALPPEDPVEEQISPHAFLVFFLSDKYISEAAYRIVNNLCKRLDQRSSKPLAQPDDINDILSFM